LKALDAAADAHAPGVLPLQRPNCWNWQSDSAGTHHRDESARRTPLQGRRRRRARTLLEPTIDELRPGLLRGVALNLMAGICMYDDTFVEAAALLERALDDAETNPALLVQTQLSLTFAQGMSGSSTNPCKTRDKPCPGGGDRLSRR